MARWISHEPEDEGQKQNKRKRERRLACEIATWRFQEEYNTIGEAAPSRPGLGARSTDPSRQLVFGQLIDEDELATKER